MIRNILVSGRHIITVASAGAFLSALVLLLVAGGYLVVTVIGAVVSPAGVLTDPKDVTQALITTIDLFLLSAGFYVIALGFYELFVDPSIPLPDWLEFKDFEDLKATLVGIIVVVIAVAFLGKVLDWSGGTDILYFGVAVGLAVASLSYFISVKSSKLRDRDRPKTSQPE